MFLKGLYQPELHQSKASSLAVHAGLPRVCRAQGLGHPGAGTAKTQTGSCVGYGYRSRQLNLLHPSPLLLKSLLGS